jgi:predicted TIM-barrel fold metal-dependent hydrolase
MSMIADRIPIVDVDSHVIEPPDLWSARMPKKYADIQPRVVHVDSRGEDFWLIGDIPASTAWGLAAAGWHEHLPSHPKRFEDVPDTMYNATARVRALDEHGVAAQVLYPNILGFSINTLLTVGDGEFHLACVQAYNDFLSDWANEAPGRFVPVMALPFWDVDASVAEIERCAANGHKGILFAGEPKKGGFPRLRDRHWDPIWAAAQANVLSINFHVGFGWIPANRGGMYKAKLAGGIDQMMTAAANDTGADGPQISLVKFTTLGLMGNAETIVELIVSGILDRFPSLKFVSVESGFGYLPYLLETMAWQWLNTGAAHANPGRMLPSEYFKRQVYGSFWFEHQSLTRLVDLYPDNVMFETDFPHPTCLAPGPVSYTDSARNVIEQNLSSLPDDLLRKILHDNAANLYKL